VTGIWIDRWGNVSVTRFFTLQVLGNLQTIFVILCFSALGLILACLKIFMRLV
jgi:hypothetical protein